MHPSRRKNLKKVPKKMLKSRIPRTPKKEGRMQSKMMERIKRMARTRKMQAKIRRMGRIKRMLVNL